MTGQCEARHSPLIPRSTCMARSRSADGVSVCFASVPQTSTPAHTMTRRHTHIHMPTSPCTNLSSPSHLDTNTCTYEIYLRITCQICNTPTLMHTYSCERHVNRLDDEPERYRVGHTHRRVHTIELPG
jgi:hypothetical protein